MIKFPIEVMGISNYCCVVKKSKFQYIHLNSTTEKTSG